MGKKIAETPAAVPHKAQPQEEAPNAEQSKKELRKFLPHSKYINLKAKLHRKRLSQAIKNIQLDKFQIKRAVQCLGKFAQENKDPADLSGKHQLVYITIDVSRIPEEHSVRPIQVKLPYPIYSPQAKSRYTVITSDQTEQKFTETVESLDVPMLKDIISYTKIRKELKQLKDKRILLASNDLLFCDWKVYNLLRQPLGKLFYEEKRFPYPIDCEQVPEHLKQDYPTYEAYINGLASHTYTMLGNGPVYSLKVAKTRQPIREQVKNIMHATYSLIAHILDNGLKPEHIRQISIKTYNSPCLPFYCFLSKEEVEGYRGDGGK